MLAIIYKALRTYVMAFILHCIFPLGCQKDAQTDSILVLQVTQVKK